jgi:hypothetical protein
MPIATPSPSAQKSDMSADLPKAGWMTPVNDLTLFYIAEKRITCSELAMKI